MTLKPSNLLVYGVTDRSWLGNSTLFQQVAEAISGGLTCLQLREKDLDDQSFLAEALELKALCHENHVPLIINDSLEIALKAGADGVHIGQSDQNAKEVREKLGDSMILGISVQTVAQAKQAVEDGADYLGVGAVFTTTTKLDANPVSLATLAEITASVDIPVVAIGGITLENVGQLKNCGLSGVAVVSGIFASKSIQSACEAFVKATIEVVG